MTNACEKCGDVEWESCGDPECPPMLRYEAMLAAEECAERYAFKPLPAFDDDGLRIDDGIAIVPGPDGPRLAVRLDPSVDRVTINLTIDEEV